MIEHIIDVATKDGAMETFVCYPARHWERQIALYRRRLG
jgi:hypothetical protein